jgi:thioredoxin-related protein
MLKRTSLVFIITVVSMQLHFGQVIISPSGVKWYTITEALELAKKEPRPILVDVYTNWCSWCSYMMKTTFASKEISDYINANFYAAKFNAETLDTVYFKGEKYFNRQIGRRPANDLTISLLDGNLTYPSLVFFDRNGEKNVVPGYKEAKDIEPYLVYFAEDLMDKIPTDKFIINFMFSFPKLFEKDHSIFNISNNIKPDTTGQVNWVEPEKIYQDKKKKKKPILLYLYADWSFSSKIMEKTSLQNRELSEKINDYYCPVKVNVSDPQVNFLGKTYTLTGEGNINQIASQFLSNNLVFPALLIFDENHNLVTTITGYMQKEQLLPLTDYFYNKIYKKQTLKEYFKSFVTIASQEKENKIEN